MDSINLAPYLDSLDGLVRKACAHLEGDLDEEQIELYDLAFVQAELLAARTLISQTEQSPQLVPVCQYFCANAIVNTTQKLAVRPQTFGLTQSELPVLDKLQDFLAPEAVAALGRQYLEEGLADDRLDDEKRIIRDTFKEFADDVVKPLAEEVHRKDLLVPPEILEPLKAMGVFGLSVPERFGGLKPDSTEDSMGMVIVTEELSRGS
ncbi:MAG: acyl-CoA dehydrogenase family protein, partial [Pseudomonadota bacterium]|nr:acyl-CoA dehydrogenase family protein [Pseudomonadota bacterium]